MATTKAKKARTKKVAKKTSRKKTVRSAAAPKRAYPRATLEAAQKIPHILKEKNGGNPWAPDEVAKALGYTSKASNAFFYEAAASRDFGLTKGGRDSGAIALSDLGRELAYAPSEEAEAKIRKQAFQRIELFVRVLDYYNGGQLPEMKYLGNTLEKEFNVHPDFHEEFSEVFKRNCEFLGIGEGYTRTPDDQVSPADDSDEPRSRDVLTLAEPETATGLTCFVVMPFRERTESYSPGFFDEVLRGLIAPAGRKAGFTVETANRQGTEVIHSTIINDLLDADLVIADLTEHNPNVLFELGMRMAHDKPVALIRAKGTGPVFDVDNMLRVLDYDPNLWSSTVERDLPKLQEHIEATWKNRDSQETYLKILRRVTERAN